VKAKVLLVATLVTLLGTPTACTTGRAGGAGGGSANGSTAAALPGSSGAPSVSRPSPLTGLAAPSGRPVLAVKIDNVGPARPQTGLTSADVIYVEQVEGGLSRILAVFSSRLPARVGPVRSARESDLELLAQYGPAGLAFSGANPGVLAAVRGSHLVDLSPHRASSAYSRRGPHTAPHNLYADPAALLRGVKGVAVARDIGFRFGPATGGGTPTIRKVVRYAAASTTFTWSRTRRRWEVSLDGRAATTTDGGRLEAATVVVQYARITSSTYHDVLGNPTPYTHTVGSGDALVLGGGVAFKARWSRPSPAVGTTFTTMDGAPLTFAPGQVWIVFAEA
jgi:hypothetical protein